MTWCFALFNSSDVHNAHLVVTSALLLLSNASCAGELHVHACFPAKHNNFSHSLILQSCKQPSTSASLLLITVSCACELHMHAHFAAKHSSVNHTLILQSCKQPNTSASLLLITASCFCEIYMHAHAQQSTVETITPLFCSCASIVQFS